MTNSPTTFTDKKGRVWDVALDLLSIRKVAASDFSELGHPSKINLLQPAKETLTGILLDPQLLFAIIWSYCNSQAVDFPTNPAEAELEFVSGISGPVVEAARNAFCEALADFFPDKKIVLFSFLKQLKGMDEKVTKKLETLAPTLDQLMEQEMDKGIEKLKAELLNNN